MKKNALRVFVAVTTVTLLIGVQQNVQAAIFKCVNAQGETYYNDKACSQNDLETQLNNIKDPVGGYIPPAFKADVKVQGSKGVVVGEESGAKNKRERSEDISKSEKLNNKDDRGDTSESSNKDANDSIESSTENTQSVKPKRVKRKGSGKTPLPTIPLKKEKLTIEPRVKIN